MTKEELKDEMKNKISMALKDPILQQGFEIICRENAELRIQNTNANLKGLEVEVAKNSHRDRANKTQDQLTKAKEIIKYLVNAYPIITKETLEKAKQFLKGENIILEDAQAGNSPFDADEVFNKEMKAYPEEKVK